MCPLPRVCLSRYVTHATEAWASATVQLKVSSHRAKAPFSSAWRQLARSARPSPLYRTALRLRRNTTPQPATSPLASTSATSFAPPRRSRLRARVKMPRQRLADHAISIDQGDPYLTIHSQDQDERCESFADPTTTTATQPSSPLSGPRPRARVGGPMARPCESGCQWASMVMPTPP